MDSLVNVVELQISRAECDSFRNTFGDDAALNSAQTGQRDCSSVMSVETFCFDGGLADDSEATLATMFAGMVLRGHPRSGWRRKEPNRAVGKHPVYVE